MPYHLDMDQFPDCMREFAIYKRVIQGCSPKTVEEYMTDLRTFAKYLKIVSNGLDPTEEILHETTIDDLTLDFFASVKSSDITEFLSYSLDGRGNNEATRSRKLSSIKAFYRYYVIKVHKLENNPASEIESPRIKKSLPKHLSFDESVLLAALKNSRRGCYENG